MAGEKIEKVHQIYQEYLADTLQFLTYSLEKAKAEEIEDKFQENLRKAKKGRH